MLLVPHRNSQEPFHAHIKQSQSMRVLVYGSKVVGLKLSRAYDRIVDSRNRVPYLLCEDIVLTMCENGQLAGGSLLENCASSFFKAVKDSRRKGMTKMIIVILRQLTFKPELYFLNTNKKIKFLRSGYILGGYIRTERDTYMRKMLS